MRLSELERKLNELLEMNVVNWKSIEDRMDFLNDLKLKLEQSQKKVQFKQFQKFIKALNHPARVLILLAINNGIKCPCELEFLTKLGQATVSHHLNLLEEGGLILKDREGKWTLLSPVENTIFKEVFPNTLNLTNKTDM